MKHLFTLACLLILVVACKTETKEQTIQSKTASKEKKELTTAEKIAQAHGIDNWKKINLIEFTFNVDKDSSHFERSWSWYRINFN